MSNKDIEDIIDYTPQPIDFNDHSTMIDVGSYTFDIDNTEQE